MYITQVIIGFGVSALFVGLLLWLNVANLWHLISTSNVGFVAVLMLWIFNGIVFAGVQFSIAIMRLSDDDTPGGGKRQTQMTPDLVPLTVPAENDSQTLLKKRLQR
jgi:hypothetical protein